MSAHTGPLDGSLIYGLDTRPPLRETLAVALQHVFAVFVGIITPPLLIAAAIHLNQSDTSYLVSMSLFVSGIATIVQTSRWGPLGSGLLSIQGTSFTFIAPVIAATGFAMQDGASAQQALGQVFGLCLAGALTVVVASRCIHLAARVITPLVTGTVVTLIGLTLLAVGMTNIGGGYDAMGAGTFGGIQNLLLAGAVMCVVLVAGSSHHPRVRMLSLVLGLGVGYALAALLGRLSLVALSESAWLAWPQPFRFGIGFNPAACLPFILMYLITVMESIGDLTATSALSGQPIAGPAYLGRVRGGLLADGVNSVLAACLNSFPSTTFAQNNGVIQVTGVASRYVGIFIGAMLMALGLLPAVGAVVQALPAPALGGVTVVLFGMVATSGIKILARVHFDRRNTLILATSLGIGLGVSFVPQVTQMLPPFLRTAFSSGVCTGGLCALLLESLLPGRTA